MRQPINDTATGGHAALEMVLELILVTYNRSVSLDNTLRQLAESPFARCHITVLDNFSTDDTAEVTARYRDKFADYRVVRHPRNIGGDYNFLRAIEISTYKYTWIVCDDDDYDFSHAAEVIAAVESCRYDLIYVASRTSVQLGCERFGATTVRQLIHDGARYHRACAFWPALIFRAGDYDNYCYQAAPYIFPSMKFIHQSIVKDYSIYVAKHPLVIRSETSTSEVDPLRMYREWVTNAALVDNTSLRANIIEQWTDKGLMKTLAFWIAVDRSRRVKGYWKRLVDIVFALTPWQKLKFLALVPVMIVPIPMSLLVRSREFVYRLMGHATDTLPPIDTVQR